MSAGWAATLLAALVLGAQGVSAQQCDPHAAGLALAFAGGRVRHASAVTGWGVGLRADARVSQSISAGASYRRDSMTRGELQTAQLNAGVHLNVFSASPCLSLTLNTSSASGLNPGDRHHNLSVPVGMMFHGSGSLAPFGGVEAIFSATDATLLGYVIRTHALGWGAVAGLRVRSGKLLSDVSLRMNSLGSGLGPQALGRARVEVGVGLGLGGEGG